MDEMLFMRLFGGGFGSGLDVTALIAFLAFALVYLLVPLIGYSPERPVGLAAALYLMIGYAGLSLLQLLMQWSQILERSGPSSPTYGQGQLTIHSLFFIAAVKLVVFLIAMILFVNGLRSVRVRRFGAEAPLSASDELQRMREENAQLRKRLAEAGEKGIHERRM